MVDKLQGRVILAKDKIQTGEIANLAITAALVAADAFSDRPVVDR